MSGLKKLLLPALLLLGIFLTPVVLSPLLLPVRGQEEIVLTILTQEWMQDVFNDDLFDEFEAAHPGVKVVRVFEPQQNEYFSPFTELDNTLNAAAERAALADVLTVSQWNFTPLETRAGLYLDLRPLAEGDPDLNIEDFLPAALDSFRWDGGLWALPVSASAELFIYNAQAFDEAGLPYPNDNWTLTDFATAARALATVGDDGEVEIPGAIAYNLGLMYRVFSGQRLYDDSTVPFTPRLDTPELTAFMTEWQALMEEEVINTPGEFDYGAVPLRLDRTWALSNPDQQDVWRAAPLPGGTTAVYAEGFAVSGGTAYPELAYELAKFVTSNGEIALRFFGDSTARRSLQDYEAENFNRTQIPAEDQAIVDAALENGLPYSEILFGDWIYAGVYPGEGEPTTDPNQPQTIDWATALPESQQMVLDALAAAQARRETTVVQVMTPVPTPVLNAGEVVLNFGLNVWISPLPNREEWEALVAEFVAADPQVGNINLNSNFGSTQDLQSADCYYLNGNYVPSADLTTLLPLDPFLDADPNFDPNDFFGTTLEQVQRDGRTYAYPVTIQPEVIWYNPEAFAQAGLPEPGNWTIDQFVTALNMLQATQEDPDDAVFRTQTFGAGHLNLLIAAFGGNPYDYSTNPPTYRFDDPVNLDAIRQVLDLARSGVIEYNELDSDGGFMGGGGEEPPLISESLNGASWRFTNRNDSNNPNPYRLATFPRGTQNTPVAYNSGGLYINASTPIPDACYRWISVVAQRPDLLLGMPARRSLLTDPVFAAAMGEDAVALFQQIGTMIDAPDAVIVPLYDFGGSTSPGTWLEQTWINRAFDNYVLEDMPLETALADAEIMIEEYRACSTTIEVRPMSELMQLSPEESQDYFEQFTDCAVAVDPTLASRFNTGQ